MKRHTYHQSWLQRKVDAYGTPLILLILVALAWYLIATGLHQTKIFFFLFPLHWFALTPIHETVDTILAGYRTLPWWIWVEIAFTIIIWLTLFFSIRGVYYTLTGINVYYGMVGVLILLFLLVFAYSIVLPIFDEINGWWNNWPGGRPLPVNS